MANIGIRFAGAKVATVEERDLHGFKPTGEMPWKYGLVLPSGDVPVGPDIRVPAVAAHQRPPRRSRPISTPVMDRRRSSNLIPVGRRLAPLDTVSRTSTPVRGEAGRLIRQPVERRDEQTGDKMHEEAEGDLRGNQRIHQAPPRVRILAALQRADRLNRGGAERGHKAEQEGDRQRQRRRQIRALASRPAGAGALDYRAG